MDFDHRVRFEREVEVFVRDAEQFLDARFHLVERGGWIRLEIVDRGDELVGVGEDFRDAEIDERNLGVPEEAELLGLREEFHAELDALVDFLPRDVREIEQLRQGSMSNADRFEMAYRRYAAKQSGTSKNVFLGLLLAGKVNFADDETDADAGHKSAHAAAAS